MIKGKAWNYGNNVNTDYILPGKYLELTDPQEMANHAMEGLDKSFSKEVNEGDIIIGGRNFGLGSSREHAPLALKYAGVGAVIAESFARIFYRNAINIGLTVLECENIHRKVDTGDIVAVNTDEGILKINNQEIIKFKAIPNFMKRILEEGGLRNYIKNYREDW
jgi:3-isopropylmalate/(R)-2-methylmalate dehydratase small subunit